MKEYTLRMKNKTLLLAFFALLFVAWKVYELLEGFEDNIWLTVLFIVALVLVSMNNIVCYFMCRIKIKDQNISHQYLFRKKKYFTFSDIVAFEYKNKCIALQLADEVLYVYERNWTNTGLLLIDLEKHAVSKTETTTSS